MRAPVCATARLKSALRRLAPKTAAITGLIFTALVALAWHFPALSGTSRGYPVLPGATRYFQAASGARALAGCATYRGFLGIRTGPAAPAPKGPAPLEWVIA
jgi:hypothetical protein